jgi:glycosyltransferase 2 family protein
VRRPSTRTILTWFGLAASAGFGFLAVRDVDAGELRSALARADYALLVPASVVLAVAILVRILRWQILFPPAHRPSLAAVTSALLIGHFFNNVLPARAGEAFRVVVLNQRVGTSRFEALGTVVAERILDVLALLLIFFALAPELPRTDWLPRALWAGALLFAVLAVSLATFALRGERPARLLLRPLALLPGVSTDRTRLAASNLLYGFGFLRRPHAALGASALTILSWLLIAVAFWLCMVAFHLGVGFEAGLLVVVAVNLAIIIPSGPAAVGVFEAATLLALSAFGIDRSLGLSYAVVLHALNVLPFIVVGYVVFHYHVRAVRREIGRDGADAAEASEALDPPS